MRSYNRMGGGGRIKSKPKGGFRSTYEYNISKYISRTPELCDRVGYESISLAYTTSHKYKPDFILPNGAIIEAKGYFTSTDRSKMLQVHKAHPELKIYFMFLKAHNKISTGSKTTYASWCDRHGFEWIEGTEFPIDWSK